MEPEICFFVQFVAVDGKLNPEIASVLKQYKRLANSGAHFRVIVGHLRKCGSKQSFTKDEMLAILNKEGVLPETYSIVETKSGVGMSKFLQDHFDIGAFGARDLAGAKLVGPTGHGWIV